MYINFKQYLLMACAISLLSPSIAAPKIDFGKIGSSDKGFRQYWELDETEHQRYQNYMEIAGKYRHQQLSPLLVLSMLAETPEDKEYYARRAAEYEQDMVKREIEAALMVSQAMSANDLSSEMQQFTDRLAGIDTLNYLPQALKDNPDNWESGDLLQLYLDKKCLNEDCLKQFSSTLKQFADKSPVEIILKYAQLNELEGISFFEELAINPSPLKFKRFDPIEHHYLQDEHHLNRALHVRENRVIAILSANTSDR